MPYVPLAQWWAGHRTYYAQLEFIEASGEGGYQTVFRCLHRHRTSDGARACRELLDAQEADRRKRPGVSQT